MDTDFSTFKNNIKKNIRLLIEYGSVSEAKELLFQYEAMEYNDLDVYAIKGVIAILEDNTVDAEKFLLEGLKVYYNNFELHYNLAYVYQNQGKTDLAVTHFKKALRYSKSDEDGEDTYLKLRELGITESKNELISEVKLEESLKIIFFHKKGMDSFLPDIINNLSLLYNVKKIEVTEYSQIDEGMKWADICWFEWCDELVAYGSKLIIANQKKIICRLHRYEALSDLPKQVNWNNVDKLIIVTDHLRKFLVSQIPQIEKMVSIVTVNNGVNLDQFDLKKREKGFNIAYVGYIHQRKNPVLLLQIMDKLKKIDKRYKLYIAGKFQDGLIELYWNYQINEMGLQKNVIFEGWQEDISHWLENKNYILSSSIHESFGYGIAEAMSRGIKPVIHNFLFATEIWDSRYLYNSIDEAINLITEGNYNSNEYRDFIEENYSLENQMKQIRLIIDNMCVNPNSAIPFNYKEYWNQRLNSKFDIEGVGYIGLGVVYNKFMYQMRFEILDYVLENIYGDISSKNVLELGPGIGMFTNFFKEKNVGQYKGVDIARISVEELSKEFTDYEFVNGDISEMAYYEKNKYDIIFAADVLLHLTDESKYIDTLRNISSSLSKEGYVILLDPISMKNVKSQSPHVIIRNLEYIVDVIDQFDLELVSWLPTAFFMNYPFDSIMLKEKGKITDRIFGLIQNVFSNELVKEDEKNSMGELLLTYEKECLVKYGIGLSQKMIILKKKSNMNQITINISDVWQLNTLVENRKWVKKNDALVSQGLSSEPLKEIESLIKLLLT